MSRFDDAFDDFYKAMFQKVHEPFEKFKIKIDKDESFTDALVRSLSVDDLKLLHDELTVILSKKGRILSDRDLSEAMRMIRYSAYSVPEIGWIEEYGYKPINTKRQYREIDRAVITAHGIRQKKNQ